MTPTDRRAEMAKILAAGYLRFLEKGLAISAEPEAPCDHVVDGREDEEVA